MEKIVRIWRMSLSYCAAQASNRRYPRPASFSKASTSEKNSARLGISKTGRTDNCPNIFRRAAKRLRRLRRALEGPAVLARGLARFVLVAAGRFEVHHGLL